MTLREVTMYRVECDAPDCGESAQEDSEFYAWLQPDVAEDDATNAGWYVGEFGHFCYEHAPRCAECPGRVDDSDRDGICADCEHEHATAATP